MSTSVRDHMLDCNHVVAWDDFKVLGGSLIIGFWRLRRVYLLEEIDLRLIRIFTPRNGFYFSFMMSIINFNSFRLLLWGTFLVNFAVC